jgi:predicted DNA-binding protein YlxM (UPF0122 family)
MSKNIDDTRGCRSQKYQYIINEICWDNDALSAFEDMSDPYHEEISCLRDELLEHVKRIMNSKLTVHQREILDMYYFKNMTQTEIADYFGTNQSSVVKSISGNTIKENGKVSFYGGSLKKLRKYCHEDAEIIEILMKLKELTE